MAVEWREITVGELAPFSYGKGLPESRRNSAGSIPVYGSNGLVGFHDEPLTAGPTIIIGRKGTVGVVHYSPVPCWPIDTTFFVSGSDPSLVRYRYYVLKSIGLEQMNADSAVPGLNRDAAHARRVRIPTSEDEQRAIAHILGTLDDKIELNRRMSETLEAMARAIFKAWFVDFEPVRAKMEGRWRCGESLPGLPAHLYDLFPSRLVDSELGEIPEGWAYLSFDEMVIANQGKYLPSDEITDFPYDDFIYPVWGGNGIRGYSRQKMYDYPVVVLTCRGSNCGLIYKTDSESWVSNIAFACEPRIGSTNFIYVYFSLCSFVDCISGSAQPQITFSILRNKQMPYPVSPKICEVFSTKVDPIFQKISMNNHLSRTLAALRDTLLPKLISGELRVKDAELFLRERGL